MWVNKKRDELSCSEAKSSSISTRSEIEMTSFIAKETLEADKISSDVINRMSNNETRVFNLIINAPPKRVELST
jgi:hypothetical protein